MRFFTKPVSRSEFKTLEKQVHAALAALKQPDITHASAVLLRHVLGSIDLSDVQVPKQSMTAQERKDYAGRISTAFGYVKPILKEFIDTQKDFIVLGSELYHGQEDKQLLFGRGTLNGILLVYEHLEQLHKESLSYSQPTQPVDNQTPFPSLT